MTAMSTFNTFGDLLRHLRKRAGMTQGDFAAAAGYSISYISALEKNQRRPDPRTVAARFIPVLAVTGDRHLVDRLLELAAAATDDNRGQEMASQRPCHPWRAQDAATRRTAAAASQAAGP